MNKRIFDRIYFYTLNNRTAAKAAVLLSKFSKLIYMAVYGLGFLLLLKYHTDRALSYVAVPFCALVFNSALRKGLNRPRPFTRSDVNALVPHAENGSFPSNHAVSSMIIALSWLLVCPKAALCFVVLAFLTGLSRVMTGVHYPLDVACGWIEAFVFALLGFIL